MDLHPTEIRILKALDRRSSVEELSKAAGLEADAVNRTISWLSTKGLVKLEEEVSEEVSLGEEGLAYARDGLPERRMLDILAAGGSPSSFPEKLKPDEVGIGLGWLRKKNLAAIKGRDSIEVLSGDETADEKLLKLLSEKGTVAASSLPSDLKDGLGLLKSRKNVVRVSEKRRVWISPTSEGMELGRTLEVKEELSQLTSAMLRSGEWKSKGFRPYDAGVFVKPEYPAKRHPLQRLIDRISDIFVAMGFSEIKGPLVESAFWNFDALFVPQDHPARDMQDTFYLQNPKSMPIPRFEEFKERIRDTHESGGDTGSAGWKYSWDEKEAKKFLLRTHTTSVTCRHLTTLRREDLPSKVFCIGKVFRNEAVDYKHLPEFFQVEGIVVDEDANFRNLLGILREFYSRMGFENIRFRPSYYPYTEMSVDPEIYVEGRGWMELGGSGIFRPEVVKPLLGFDCPVLAWGLGLDRIVALSLGLSDIRELYISDLDWLRKSKAV